MFFGNNGFGNIVWLIFILIILCALFGCGVTGNACGCDCGCGCGRQGRFGDDCGC